MNLPSTTHMKFDDSGMGRIWWLILLFGVLSTLFGLYCIFNPIGAGVSLMWVVGIFAITEGIVGLIGALKSESEGRGWMILYALFSLVFGGLAVFSPGSMAMAFMVVLGAWIIFSGVLRVSFAIRVRKQIDNEWMLIAGGVLAILFGALLLVAPFVGLAVAVIWIGIGALFYGLLQVFAAFKIRRLAKS